MRISVWSSDVCSSDLRSIGMSLARVQNLAISLDGFGTGEGLSRDRPFGHADERLHEWMFETRWWRERSSQPGGTGGIDDALVRQPDAGIGAGLMGAGKDGVAGGPDDLARRGRGGTKQRCHDRDRGGEGKGWLGR